MSDATGNEEPVLAGDLADLPDNVLDSRNLNTWGIVGFMVIEGMGFALAAVVVFYLATQATPWPPPGTAPPDIGFGILFTAILLASEWPNRLTAQWAKARRFSAMRGGMLLMTLIGVVLIAVRGFELVHMNTRWSDSAYASALWMLMVLHTMHLVTDVADTAVQVGWLYRKNVQDKQFSGAIDNCLYWDFVVLTWLPIYVLIYWLPRFGAHG